MTALLFGTLSCLQAQVDSTAEIVPQNITANAKMNGKWTLIPAMDSDTASGHIPDIQFDVKEGKFSGNTGCNRMTGSYIVTDSNTIHFSKKMVTTRLFCAGYNESAFLQNLIRIDNYKFRKGMLIFSVGKVEVFRWKRKAPPTPKKPVKVQVN